MSGAAVAAMMFMHNNQVRREQPRGRRTYHEEVYIRDGTAYVESPKEKPKNKKKATHK